MKIAKRIVSLLLVLVLMLSIPLAVTAAQSSAAAGIVMAEEPEDGEELDDGSDEVVAKMYLMVSNADPKEPHVWIYIENTSNEKLQLLDDYTIGKNSAVSMGAWKARGTDEAGIYMNLERHWIKDATYERTYYMCTDVTRAELKEVGEAMALHDYWNWVFNCGWFATSMWNICSPRKILYLFFPQLIRVEMILFGAKKLTTLDHKIPKMTDASKCYKYHVDGITVCCYRATTSTVGV